MTPQELLQKYSLFSLGRLSRLEHVRNIFIGCIVQWLWVIVMIPSTTALSNHLWQVSSGDAIDSAFKIFMPLLALATLAVGAIIGVYATIQRLHDLNRSGWWFLLFLIPLVNLVLFVYVFFVKGTAGPNTYGPDPLIPVPVPPVPDPSV